MDCSATRLSYLQTKVFNHIVLDYLSQAPTLQPFFAHPPTIAGLKNAIEKRQGFKGHHAVLVKQLKQQYKGLKVSAATEANIEALSRPTTFTITTAHQPNIFTGPLYFIYKILHAIKLADSCKTLFPEYDFVPVYYMGSEDADLDELGHFYISDQKFTWGTEQTGAVGRMKVDQALLKLLEEAEGQLSVLTNGAKLFELIREHYKDGVNIQDATLGLVNALFADFGLVVLVPDSAALKKVMVDIFRDDLEHQTASGIVNTTAAALKDAGYKIQANPREINLFYLHDDLRGRIELINDKYVVHDSKFQFTPDKLLQELSEHPERFSPNVILRGIFQEIILPNIAFIGGGGEMAYWLQLQELFKHYQVPYPVLVLRNSFLIIEKRLQNKLGKLGFSLEDLFFSNQELLNKLVHRDSDKQLKLNGTLQETEALYDHLKSQAASIDTTLEKHVEALKVKTVYRLKELEKKMLRAEKRKHTDGARQIEDIRRQLFPTGNLQERVENFMPYYARWGNDFIQELYRHTLTLEQEFVVLQENAGD
jgi:bacillithiol biosynthesis cysteine-adding enzyme BshC